MNKNLDNTQADSKEAVMLKNSIKAEHSFTSAQPEDIEGAVTNIKTEDIEDSTKSESSIATEVIADVKT